MKKDIKFYKKLATAFIEAGSPGPYGLKGTLQENGTLALVINQMAHFARSVAEPKRKPISQIVDDTPALKKMFALYVQEGYEGQGFAEFAKAVKEEGFDDLKVMGRMVHGIEELGFTFDED